MQHQSLFSTIKKSSSNSAHTSTKFPKSEIKPTMDAKAIGDVISTHLMSHVDKALKTVAKKQV